MISQLIQDLKQKIIDARNGIFLYNYSVKTSNVQSDSKLTSLHTKFLKWSMLQLPHFSVSYALYSWHHPANGQYRIFVKKSL